jgi:ketopantoate reductase
MITQEVDPYSLAYSCYTKTTHSDIDVVMVAVKPTCITHQAVAGINRFIGPRSIIVIAPSVSKCAPH